MAKTSALILQEMIDYLSVSTNFTDVDKSEGSVLRDVVLDSVARQLELVYSEIDTAKQLVFFVDNAAIISVVDMDSIAKNFNLVRLPASKSTGKVLFRKKNAPSSPITIGNVDGSGGIVLSTRQLENGSTVKFITTGTVVLATNATLNPNTNYYEVAADIEAIIEGEAGNVSAGSITNMESAIVGIDTVYNVIPTGLGTPVETNTELASRIVLAIAGNNRVNRAGYELFIKNNFPNVKDILAIDPNNPNSVRGPGTIDIVVLGTGTQSNTENNTYVSGLTEYSFTKMPVNEITSLSALISGVNKILTQNTDYELLKDKTSTNAYSNSTNDKIKFKDGGLKPDIGTDFSVTYSYNGLVGEIQKFYDLDENRILSVDVMIKEALAVNLDVAFSVNYYSGNASRIAELETNIVNAITDYFNSQSLGSVITQSDIVFAVRTAVPEIDNIVLPFTAFKRRTDAVNSDSITMGSNEYIEADSLTFIITPI